MLMQQKDILWYFRALVCQNLNVKGAGKEVKDEGSKVIAPAQSNSRRNNHLYKTIKGVSKKINTFVNF